jgi:hypothetical protein
MVNKWGFASGRKGGDATKKERSCTGWLSSSEGPAPSTGRHQCEELENFTEVFHLLEKFTGLRDPSGAITWARTHPLEQEAHNTPTGAGRDPLATQHYPMLQRNLYTGVARGKRLVVLVGQQKALAIAVKGARTWRRWSKLREWLIG